jgi:endonuclease YncB( thermonuclease family)
MGTLKIKGTIKLDQFWPKGTSDADTTKINLKVDANSFLFKKTGATSFKKTAVYFNAKAVPEFGPPVNVIKYANTPRQYVTIRLQGIDAPELHYRMYGIPPKKDPIKEKKFLSNTQYKKFKEENARHEYRQRFSETATVALHDFLKLKANSSNEIECVFVSSNIDTPSDAIDVYGRVVGDITVDNEKINLNNWLLEEGWVMPSYYNSSTNAEITKLDKLYNKGAKKSNRTIKNYSAALLPFDHKLVYRKKGAINAAKDKGKLILPKLYRRHCIFSIYKKAGIPMTSFTDYLKAKKRDKYILPNQIVAYNKAVKNKNAAAIAKLEKPFASLFFNNKLNIAVNKMVIIEKPSKIIDGVTKKLITKF